MARADQVTHYRPALEQALAFSQAVTSGPYLLLSGVLSMDRDGNCIGPGEMTAQVTAVYSHVAEILADHGLGFEHVVRETVYTTDMPALVAAAPIRAKFFESVRGPAATWVEVRGLFQPGYLLEVEITAELPVRRA